MSLPLLELLDNVITKQISLVQMHFLFATRSKITDGLCKPWSNTRVYPKLSGLSL
jgi:hypothetical protein